SFPRVSAGLPDDSLILPSDHQPAFAGSLEQPEVDEPGDRGPYIVRDRMVTVDRIEHHELVGAERTSYVARCLLEEPEESLIFDPPVKGQSDLEAVGAREVQRVFTLLYGRCE